MEIFLIRHTESEGNATGLLQSASDALTPKGRKQIAFLRNELTNISFDVILTSPMIRCKQLAIGIFGHEHVIESVLLEEKRNGILEGKKEESIDWADINNKPFMERRIPGGESLNDVLLRANKIIVQLKSLKANRVAIISHGTFLRVLLCAMTGADVEKTIMTKQIVNGQIIRVLLENGKFSIVSDW